MAHDIHREAPAMTEADHHPPAIARTGSTKPCAICGPVTGRANDDVVIFHRYLICDACHEAAFRIVRREVLQFRGILGLDLMVGGEGKSNG